MNIKSLLLPGGAGAILAVMFPVPLTALGLVAAALLAWMLSWMAGVAVSLHTRTYSWQKCIGGLVQRIIAYTVLAAAAAAITMLIGALLVEVSHIPPAGLRRIVWAPVCCIASMVGFAETISLLRSASRLLPNEESGRQIRKWLKPLVFLLQEMGERTIEGQRNLMEGSIKMLQPKTEPKK